MSTRTPDELTHAQVIGEPSRKSSARHASMHKIGRIAQFCERGGAGSSSQINNSVM
jgi:hypothetical protein